MDVDSHLGFEKVYLSFLSYYLCRSEGIDIRERTVERRGSGGGDARLTASHRATATLSLITVERINYQPSILHRQSSDTVNNSIVTIHVSRNYMPKHSKPMRFIDECTVCTC